MAKIKVKFSGTVGGVADAKMMAHIKALSGCSTCPAHHPATPVAPVADLATIDPTLAALIRAEVALQMQVQLEKVRKLMKRSLVYGAEP